MKKTEGRKSRATVPLSSKVHSYFLAKLMMIEKNALSKKLLSFNKLKSVKGTLFYFKYGILNTHFDCMIPCVSILYQI
jgi:hypothetical protein